MKELRRVNLLNNFDHLRMVRLLKAPPLEQYHEDVVSLYNAIIEDCKESQIFRLVFVNTKLLERRLP